MVGEAAGEVVGGELVARGEGVEGQVGGELAEERVVGLEVGGVVGESGFAGGACVSLIVSMLLLKIGDWGDFYL